MILRALFAFFLIALSPLSAKEELAGKQLLAELGASAKPGQYMVLSLNRHYNFLKIIGLDAQKLVLEEIAISWSKRDRQKEDWKQWRQRGAPGNHLWLETTIDLQTGEILSTYSHTHQSLVSSEKRENFFSTLLTLKAQKIPQERRRKLGPAPKIDSKDTRPLWQPKLVFEGKELQSASFEAFEAQWPKDRSELSGKRLFFYLPQRTSAPAFLPHFIEVSALAANSVVQAVDSGNLK